MAGKIMNADIQSAAELISKGATAAQLPNDDKVYVTANSVNKTLKQAIIDGDIGGSSPTGSVTMFAGSSAPSGWFLCDGSAVSRTTYSALFAVIGTDYGVGDGSTTFNLPDTRGIFVKGAGSQTISSITYSGTLASKQNDQMQSHIHSFRFFGSPTTPDGVVPTTNAGTIGNGNIVTANGSRITGNEVEILSPSTEGANGTPRVGAQTYPANISFNYIIKA